MRDYTRGRRKASRFENEGREFEVVGHGGADDEGSFEERDGVEEEEDEDWRM